MRPTSVDGSVPSGAHHEQRTQYAPWARQRLHGRQFRGEDYPSGELSSGRRLSSRANSEVQHVGVNETFECVLGIDARIKVSSQQWSHGEAAHDCTDTAQTMVYTSVITLMNGHDVDVARLVVRDAVPLGDEREKTNVTLRKPAWLAQAKGGDDVALALDTDVGPFNSVKVQWMKTKDGSAGKEYGMYEWMCGIRAGTKLALEAEWVVTGSIR